LTNGETRTCRSRDWFYAFKNGEIYEFSHAFDGIKRRKKLEGGKELPNDRMRYMSVCLEKHIMQVFVTADKEFEDCHFIDCNTLRATQDHPHFSKVVGYFK
jgi:hypothetical protein